MSIGETLSRLLLKRLVEDVFRTGGVEALDAVMDFLTRCGQQNDPRLTEALGQAMHRAWGALEAALTGEPSWDHSQAGLAPRDARALRQCLGRVLAELAHGGAATGQPTALVVANALRRQCLGDLRSAREGGALAGCLDREEWARSNEVFVRFAVNQGRRDTRRRTEGQLLRDLEQHGCVGLMRVLTAGAGLPLLLMAARAFLCQELAHLLYRCLQDSPEQTPDNCTLVLEILQELSSPRFSIWRSPALPAAPVHWSRLESRSGARRVNPRRPAAKHRPGRGPSGNRLTPWQTLGRSQQKQYAAETTPRAFWALVSVLTIAVALLVVLPIWLLVENAQRNESERQHVAAERQRLRDERRRVEEERQRLIDAQQRIAREEAARQDALRRQREEEERRQRLEAEEERQRAEERAVQQREEERRRRAEERQTLLREKQQRLDRARVALEDGLTLAARRQDREALTAFSEALMLDPNLIRAWSARGVVRRRMGDLAGALEDFQEAVRRNPDDIRCWFHCGELHAGRREYPQAIDAFTAVLRLEPDNVEAYRQRGLCHASNGDVDKALADQAKAIDLAPNDPWAYYYRANLHRLRNDLDRAFEDYTAAIARDRANHRGLAGAYRGRGMLSLHRQKYEQAIQDLTQALELDPADTVAQRARSTAYLHNGDWNKALLGAEGLIHHNADDSAAYKLRGQAYMGLGEYQRASEDFTRALRKERDAETFYLRARARVHLGDIKEAIFDCNNATSLNPRLASAFYLRGKLNLRTGYRVSGLDDCRMAHELDPQFPLP
jgi:tetratricopeptide (TPR) repeat protein